TPMRLAVSFTNLGPYHLARLRALAAALHREGGELLVYETAGTERRYPWLTPRSEEPFTWTTLFPGRSVESVPASSCAEAISEALTRDLPDVVALCGYVRPECLSALEWSKRYRRLSVLMSESQRIDRPRVWWKEAIKRRRVQRFDAALVGGASHRDYLVELGLPIHRIALGYNAVDNLRYARLSERARTDLVARQSVPVRPYFLCVARFVPEKNLTTLVHAFARYRESADPHSAWDLALCGSGPDEAEVEHLIRSLGLSDAIHRPGFLQADELAVWYAFASGFVLPSVSEPWGLVVNEAAACGLPLLVSDRAGCAQTLVPDPPGTTGLRFDPWDVEAMTASLAWLSIVSPEERSRLGRCSASVVAQWGPDRFARGMVEAISLARQVPHPSRSAAPKRVVTP
ncbi:MAG TPA: glycosyltransferase family 4 protein, partial [Isosphaeraceae bacterium]|nr:glycosyltransferase family 4 protein [Isosphaeraceae bacterium]